MGLPAAGVGTRPATTLLLLIAMLANVGCHVGPDYCAVTPPLPDAWHQELIDGELVGQAELHHWWSSFNDPILDQLINVARNNNRDLRVALSRIDQAVAQARMATSPRLPIVDQVGSYEKFKLSENAPLFFPGLSPDGPTDDWKLGFDVSWEPDFFGRVSRTIEAANGEVDASVEEYRDVLVCLYAQIARDYISLRASQAQKEYTLKNVALQQKSRGQAQNRLDAGLVPELDVHQADLNLARTAAEVPRLEEAIQRRINAITLLVGEFSGSLHIALEPTRPIPNPTPPSVGLPANVIRQRPDIRQAERLVAVQTAKIGIATSELYPRFSIGGNIGLEATNLSKLLVNDSLSYGLGPSFRWSIFNTARVRNNIKKEQAATEEAFAHYEQTILKALREVEDALAAYRQEQLRRDQLNKAVDAATKAVENVSGLYRAGKTNFQNVLVTEQSLAQAQNQIAESEGQVAMNLVLLYKALGGGWRIDDDCLPDAYRGNAVANAVASAEEASPAESPVEMVDAGSAPNGDVSESVDPGSVHSAGLPQSPTEGTPIEIKLPNNMTIKIISGSTSAPVVQTIQH